MGHCAEFQISVLNVTFVISGFYVEHCAEIQTILLTVTFDISGFYVGYSTRFQGSAGIR